MYMRLMVLILVMLVLSSCVPVVRVPDTKLKDVGELITTTSTNATVSGDLILLELDVATCIVYEGIDLECDFHD